MMCISRRHIAENGRCKHQVGQNKKGVTAKFSWNGKSAQETAIKMQTGAALDFCNCFTTVLVDSAHVASAGLQAEFMVQQSADCWHFRDGLCACREHLLSDGGDVQSMWYNWSKGYSSLWCWSVSHSEKRSFLCEAATVCAFLSVFICSSAVPRKLHCHTLHYSLPLFSQSPYVRMINCASVCTRGGGFLD